MRGRGLHLGTPAGERRPRRRCWDGLVVAAVCALALAACGSSGRTPGNPSREHAVLAFSECMRSHGVSNFPDPSSGGRLNLDGTGINPFSPSFESARSSCATLLAGSGPGSRSATEQQKQQFVAISRCMRTHGVTGFPDPTTTPPSSVQELRQYSLAEGVADNLFLLVPKTIDVNSPAFRRAASACGLR